MKYYRLSVFEILSRVSLSEVEHACDSGQKLKIPFVNTLSNSNYVLKIVIIGQIVQDTEFIEYPFKS